MSDDARAITPVAASLTEGASPPVPRRRISRVDILALLILLAAWSYCAFRFVETRLADGWLSANVVLQAQLLSVSRTKAPRATVEHDGRQLTVEIAGSDGNGFQIGQRICVVHVPATGYAGQCRDGRLDDRLGRAALVQLFIASAAVLLVVLALALRLSGRIGRDPATGMEVTLPPKPKS